MLSKALFRARVQADPVIQPTTVAATDLFSGAVPAGRREQLHRRRCRFGLARILSLLPAVWAGVALEALAAPLPDNVLSETQGHADRIAFENWTHGLNAEQRRGADFWATERSKPTPSASCVGAPPSADYMAACRDAQRRLAVSDIKRKADPDYRKGWNASLAVAATQEAGGLSAGPSPALPSQPPTSIAQIFSSAIGLSVSQIKQAYPGTDCTGGFCEFQPGKAPQAYCPSAGACDKLVLYIGHDRITGYQTNLDMLDWVQSLQATANSLGKAKRESIGSRSIEMRTDYWSWMSGDSFDVSYEHAYGVDITGNPFRIYRAVITPAGKS